MEHLLTRPLGPKRLTCLLSTKKIFHHKCRSYISLKSSQTLSADAVYQKCTYCQVRQLKNEYRDIKGLLSRLDATISLPRTLTGQHRLFSTADEKKSNDDDKQSSADDSQQNNKGPDDIKNLFIDIGFSFCVAALYTWHLKTTASGIHVKTVTFDEFVSDYLMKGKVSYVTIQPNIDGTEVPQATLILTNEMRQNQRNVQRGLVQNKLNIDLQGCSGFESMLREVETNLNVAERERIRINRDPSNYLSAETVNNFLKGAFCYAVCCTFLALRLVRRIPFMKGFGKKEPVKKQQKPKDSALENVINNMMWDEELLKRGDKLMKEQNITFKDVAGLHEAKVEVFEFVKYLKNRDIVKELGGKPPTGALLLGPPGCGKTLLAKAIASECEVPFYYMAGSELTHMIVGVGAKKVRTMFQTARQNAPCIIYIDEIDAIGRRRDRTNDGEEQVLNQLLTELDGMNERKDVIMLASTNRADMLDKALLRPGRFDRHITIDLPTLTERTELFELYLRKLKLKSPLTTYAGKLSQLTPGMSGADIANICNEAAIHAARESKDFVSAPDFDYAVERVIAGAAKSTNTLTYGEKKVIAYHEAGHALVGWLLEHTDALLKVTIVPRTSNILGFAQYLPQENKLYSNDQLFEMMCMALGGRVAESVIFNRITNGAQDDLNRVTKIAYAQIKTHGMSKNVGLMSFPTEDEYGIKPYSKRYQNILDLEARQMVGDAYRRTEKIIQDNIEKLHKVANLLLEKETISAAQVEALIGPPPFGKKQMIDPQTLYDDELA